MKIKTLLFSSLLLSITQQAYADKYMMIMGGGGEPTGETTIFDTTMQMLGNNLGSSDWKYSMSFNGGHAKTEQLMANTYNKAVSPNNNFTADNYNKMIAEYKAKIIMGEIKSGDQLVIMMNTHGAAKSGKEKTHLVAASGGAATDLNNLSGTKLVSMDALEELVKLSNEKGINLGIVDLSCHSGNTMSLKENAPNTCVIAATGPKHYGYAGETAFTGKFAQNLKKGVTLEQAFLKARAESNDASFPMISTDENNAIVAEVYASMTPFLYYYDPAADKLSDYILSASKDCVTCTRETQFASLIAKIDQLSQAAKGQKNGFNGEELKRLLTTYKSQQDELINAHKALGADVMDKKENFAATISIKGRKAPFVFERKNMSWGEILSMNPDDTIRTFEKYRDNSKSEYAKADNQVVIDGWKQIKAKKEEILAKFPRLSTVEADGKKLVAAIGNNRDTSEKIALQEKKFYDELYRQKQSLNTNDPCRKIVF